jgi:hypothetical protein
VIDNWAQPAAAARTAAVTLAANVPQAIRVEFRDASGAARLQLAWLKPGQTAYTAVPLNAFTPQ